MGIIRRGGIKTGVIGGKDYGSGGGSSSKTLAQQYQINKTLADMRAGRISQSDAAAQVKIIQRGGGSGLAADPRLFASAQAAIKKAEKIRQEQEAARKLREQIKEGKEQKAFGQTVEGQVKINVSGGVTVGGVKYSGTAVVPGTGGMTANAYSKSVKGGLVKTGQIDVKDIGRTGVTLKTGDETLTTGEKIVYDMFGVASGVEADLGRGRQSFSVEEYNKEVERLQKVSPKTAVLDTSTGLLSSGTLTPVKFGGADLYPRSKVKVYTDPVTGEVIKDIGGYLKEKDIPYSTTPEKFTSFKNIVKEQPTYDTLGLQSKAYKGGFGEGGGKVGDEWLPTSAAVGTIMPITPSDVFNVAGGGLAAAKVGLFTGASFLLSKPITAVTSKGIDYIIPRTDSGFKPSGIPAQVGRGLLFSATLPITGKAMGFEFAKGLSTAPIETAKGFKEYAVKNPYELATIVGAKPIYSSIERQFLKKPTSIKPTPTFEQEVQPYSRQRATLILKDPKGDYIFGKTKQGDIISIGGGIEKGQTPLKAVLAELKQETGLGKSDLLGLKFRKKFVTPEETFLKFNLLVTL